MKPLETVKEIEAAATKLVAVVAEIERQIPKVELDTVMEAIELLINSVIRESMSATILLSEYSALAKLRMMQKSMELGDVKNEQETKH